MASIRAVEEVVGGKDGEEPEEYEEEEEAACDECFRILDELEGEENDGLCWDCAKLIKANEVRRMLPSNYDIRVVCGNHRKPCSDCGKSDWCPGDYYVFNSVNPYGTDKFCLDCARVHDWDGDEDDEDPRSYYARGYNQPPVSAATLSSMMFDPSSHTGLDHNRYPTAGTLHIGGLSSAIVNPNLRKMSRDCRRSNPDGRGPRTQRCPGRIESFTEAGFQLATCSFCFLPADQDEAQTSTATKRDSPNASQGGNKKRRV